MQLKQKYTINNVTYENEMFVSDKDNIDIYSLMFHFFRINTENNITEQAELFDKTTESITIPVEHTENETPVLVVNEENKNGYYIKYTVRGVKYERWSNAKNENNAKAIVYSTAKKESWVAGYKVDYEILELKPMTKQEFDNRNSK